MENVKKSEKIKKSQQIAKKTKKNPFFCENLKFWRNMFCGEKECAENQLSTEN